MNLIKSTVAARSVKSLVARVVTTTAVVLAFAGLAHAKNRYIVIYNSQQGFSAMNNFMAKSVNPNLKVQQSLENINAMIIETQDANALSALRSNPEVALVEAEVIKASPRPVHGRIGPAVMKASNWSRLAAPPTDVILPQDFKAGQNTPWGILAVKAPEAWKLSDAGAKARVLVLDTGIDKEHQSLKANFEQGKNFVPSANGKIDPTNFVDGEGHGSHTSGTVGASIDNTGFTGVAPSVKLLMGRVCGLQANGVTDGCSNIDVAQGINWGISQKVDVISMSLGGQSTTPAEKLSIANAEKAGVVVVAASGNDNENYPGKVSFPAAYPTVVAVGALDINLVKTSFSQYGPELDIMGPGAKVLSSVPRGTGRASEMNLTQDGQTNLVNSESFAGVKATTTPTVGELVPAGLGKPEELAAVNVAGKIALISRGEIAFSDKVKNALAAKAIGVVIYNNAAGPLLGTLTQEGEAELDVAAVAIDQATGLALVEAIGKGQVSVASIITKPTDYAYFDGTSMATPHVAGVVALIKSANKKLTPAQVRAIITATAMPLGTSTVNEYGKGLIQADKAVKMALGM